MTGDEAETVEDAVAVESSEEGSEEEEEEEEVGGWPDLFRPDLRAIPLSDFGDCHRTREHHRWVGDTLGAWSRGVGNQGAFLRVEGVDGDVDGGDGPSAIPNISYEIFSSWS